MLAIAFQATAEIGFLEWLQGMRDFGAGIGPRYVEFLTAAKQRLLADSNFPLSALALFGAIWAVVSLPGRARGWGRLIAALGIVCLLGLAAYGLESAFKIYVFLPLLALAVPLAAAAVARLSEDRRNCLAALLCVCFLPASFGAARAGIAWTDYLIEGVSLNEARSALLPELAQFRGPIAVTPVTLGLFDELNELRVCESDPQGRLRFRGESCDLAVFEERVLNAQLGVLRGYRCVVRTATSSSPRLLGLPYANFRIDFSAGILRYDPDASSGTLTQAMLDACPLRRKE
ncbi:MAG: hypothetical protein WEA84_14680 [Rhodovibrionaceae bacterium]